MALVSLLVALAVAGCAGKAKPQADGGALASLDAKQVEVATGKGAIKGIVVDEAVRPIPRATVELRGAGTRVAADDHGQFVFGGLDPGTYFLAANATRFLPAQTSVEVKAGEVAVARVQLIARNDPTPYHVTSHFRGHMTLYASIASFALELLVPNSALCQCTFNLTPDPDAKTFVYEATGKAAVSNPTPLYGTVYWEFIGMPQDDIHSAHTDFPIHEVFKRDAFANDTQTWIVRLTGSQWVHYNTDFDIFLTTFYHEEAPKEWSFLKGDT